jgi:hypothetical protein
MLQKLSCGIKTISGLFRQPYESMAPHIREEVPSSATLVEQDGKNDRPEKENDVDIEHA